MRLFERYRGIVCDLDGVVYRGPEAVPHAVEALQSAHAAGVGVAYATNNASRPPQQVYEQLRGLGLDLELRDVLTSAQAGARHLAEVLPAGGRVLAIGGPGVRLALQESGLQPVLPSQLEAAAAQQESFEPVLAVLQGFGPDVSSSDLSQGAFAIQEGALWVVTNNDTTLPTARGLAPGNGALVGALKHAVGIEPTVVGKPEAPLYLVCAQVLGCEPSETLAVGDRLDTDLAGAVASGMDGLYVRTGVSRPVDVALADHSMRPRYIAADLRALTQEYDEAEVQSGQGEVQASCGQARVSLGASLELHEGGTPSQRLRAFVAACWAAEELDPSTWGDVDSWVDAGETS
ncbi:HAD-IIA family hydrolase [Gephyromycinifex aptenodytis]|uniref:HAD-IIA family hydrolase n=1 Tax=Gephyromycinifex aptenodytis TaxID=2716227 RepID=UPI0014473A8D|nr:HAD-IIA family hydrolase [Gephyromycinifex aptenodytis]